MRQNKHLLMEQVLTDEKEQTFNDEREQVFSDEK